MLRITTLGPDAWHTAAMHARLSCRQLTVASLQAYHQLNHYNLFGGGYYNRAYGLLQELPGAVE